ncbi:hypothetical protein [Saccharospirillum sp.]|uniref:hypothetical protein n=1 Tax=Saccharospirillum sp. TaxID=2033801 RepID=UPI0034A011BD
MKRKNPHNSTTETAKAFQDTAEGLIQPPPHVNLRSQDWPHWESVTTAKARDAWTTADLEIAAQLARTMADIPRLRSEIDIEGDTIVQPGTGNTVVNPRHKILDAAVKRSITLTRLLQIHPLATQGRSADQAGRNQAQRQTSDTAESMKDDDLIATPAKRRH